MEHRLVAARKRRANTLALGPSAPVGSCRHRAVMRGEANQNGIAAVFFAHELPDIELPAPAHLGGARVAEMRVVRPNGDLRATTVLAEMLDQRLERLHHMAVAQIPRRYFFE